MCKPQPAIQFSLSVKIGTCAKQSGELPPMSLTLFSCLSCCVYYKLTRGLSSLPYGHWYCQSAVDLLEEATLPYISLLFKLDFKGKCWKYRHSRTRQPCWQNMIIFIYLSKSTLQVVNYRCLTYPPCSLGDFLK